MEIPKRQDYSEEEWETLIDTVNTDTWKVLRKYFNNIKDDRNQQAILLRDKTSLLLFERMDEVDQIIVGIENLAPDDGEPVDMRIRKLEEYMP